MSCFDCGSKNHCTEFCFKFRPELLTKYLPSIAKKHNFNISRYQNSCPCTLYQVFLKIVKKDTRSISRVHNHAAADHKCSICEKKGFDHSIFKCPEICTCINNVLTVLHSKKNHCCSICDRNGHFEQECKNRCLCRDNLSNDYHKIFNLVFLGLKEHINRDVLYYLFYSFIKPFYIEKMNVLINIHTQSGIRISRFGIIGKSSNSNCKSFHCCFVCGETDPDHFYWRCDKYCPCVDSTLILNKIHECLIMNVPIHFHHGHMLKDHRCNVCAQCGHLEEYCPYRCNCIDVINKRLLTDHSDKNRKIFQTCLKKHEYGMSEKNHNCNICLEEGFAHFDEECLFQFNSKTCCGCYCSYELTNSNDSAFELHCDLCNRIIACSSCYSDEKQYKHYCKICRRKLKIFNDNDV